LRRGSLNGEIGLKAMAKGRITATEMSDSEQAAIRRAYELAGTGACVSCGVTLKRATGRWPRCKACQTLHKSNARETRREHGHCLDCPEPAVEGHARCAAHLRENSIATSDKTARRARARELGICVDCPKPAASGRSRCKTHLEYNRRHAAKRLAAG
jgi:hypothetical protein